jgi:hypothetical protein
VKSSLDAVWPLVAQKRVQSGRRDDTLRARLFLLLCGVAVTDTVIREQPRKYLIESLQQSWKADGAIKIDDVLGIISKRADETPRQSLEMADRMASMLAHATRIDLRPAV